MFPFILAIFVIIVLCWFVCDGDFLMVVFNYLKVSLANTGQCAGTIYQSILSLESWGCNN